MKIVFANDRHDHIVNELVKRGHEVIAPLFRGDFDLDLNTLSETIQSQNPQAVIGVGRGGSLVMAANPSQPIVLIAPRYREDKIDLKKPAIVIHGALDEVVPIEDSLKLDDVWLHMVQDDHWCMGPTLPSLYGVLAELS